MNIDDKMRLNMRKIAIFQSDLSMGGIQKSIINVLTNLDYSKYEVDLYLFGKTNDFGVSLPDKVNVIYMEAFPRFTKVFPFELMKKLYGKRFSSIDKEYDVAADFNSYWMECSVGAVCVNAKKRVMWIHNDVAIKLKEDKKYRALWRAFKGKFKYFDKYAPVSAGLIPGFSKESGVENTGENFIVAPNFIDTDEIKKKMEEKIDFSPDPETVNFVTVGTLWHQKGYDIMLDVFAKAVEKADHPMHLYIIGDGQDRDALIAQRDSLSLADKVTFLGRKTNPFPYEAACDAFVSTSRYEGQPLVIQEAAAVGLPIVIAKNLEIYTEGYKGHEDMAKAFCETGKATPQFNDLRDYNGKVLDRVDALFGK